ncbi:MAG: pilin [Candidatus Pacebacteria bacterium]|nr:pilin [Candidatus Paceibacterota bacterium]
MKKTVEIKGFLMTLLIILFLGFFGIKYSLATESFRCGPCGSDGFTCREGIGLECINGQCQYSGEITFCPGSEKKEVGDLVNEVMKWVLILGLTVAPLMILLGGFMLFTAGGDPKATDKAKQVIKWAVIGLAIILFARAFVSILRYLI